MLVISKAQGNTLGTQWSQISVTEKLHVKWQLRKAIQALKSIGSVCVDASKSNILYAPATGSVTMIDFEIVQAVDGTVMEEVPELRAIFGREAIGESGQRHAGG